MVAASGASLWLKYCQPCQTCQTLLRTGCSFRHENDTALLLSRLISRAATSSVLESFLQHLHPSFSPSEDSLSRIVQLLVSIATALRQDADVSISFIDGNLVEDRVFIQNENAEQSEQHLLHKSRREHLIFTATGWMTNLLLVLFDGNARRVYRKSHRPTLLGKKRDQGVFDPELDVVCLGNMAVLVG
ncbi:hypothetical protein QBC46DRAFT_340523 [Diplogelasinospora grovesii]|uniref:Uncharacterized protein n=1 Tax=Diplogelasinospora grovesii TaxID=303347 RepID=A0AAN6S5P3_9PEZI|nr:hypothetical protein QBC46DRAFT_340523 [Diplogelasinospora grovesii]